MGRTSRRALKAAGAVAVAVTVVVLLDVLTQSHIRSLVALSDEEQAARLWNRTFYAVSVDRAIEPHDLVPDTELIVAFRKRPDWEGVAWEAGCNFYGAEVTVTKRWLRTGATQFTLSECPQDLREQDGWLYDFFSPNPAWELDDGRLRLTSGQTTIELVEESQGPHPYTTRGRLMR